ncbi:ubiquinol-cytochrome c reductase complex assembly factor 4 [Myripristis murdjan]|uniref:ubiquinol-cytochrome c reductase complex assembly factor 4 n=1 Tax=Myripristis murdjan TaxID=586833 RepID=UPI001175F481|nr:protein CCSMST1 [Myripristis murdjan]
MSRGRVLVSLARFSLNRGVSAHHATTTPRLNHARSLAVASQRWARSKEEDEEVNSEPIKFTTSKASHRSWRVDRSMGSQFQRPLRKVLPISLLGIGFLLWCAFRGETDIDAQLEKHLYENFPGLLSDEEPEQTTNKPS